MRIKVKDVKEETNLWLLIPNGLVLNRLTARFIPRALESSGMSVTQEQVLVFMKALKDFKKRHKGWKLVEVHSADGSIVEITL